MRCSSSCGFALLGGELQDQECAEQKGRDQDDDREQHQMREERRSPEQAGKVERPGSPRTRRGWGRTTSAAIWLVGGLELHGFPVLANLSALRAPGLSVQGTQERCSCSAVQLV